MLTMDEIHPNKPSQLGKLLADLNTKKTEEKSLQKPAKTQAPTNNLVLPVVPIREGVLFPSTESILTLAEVFL
mgnify:FL=1